MIKTMPSWVAGLTLAGVCAAVQSSLNTMALSMCSMVVMDMYSVARPNTPEKKIKKINIIVTILVSCILFYIAFDPPPLLSAVALYAMGGLAVCFVPELIIGMHWPRGNVQGAIVGTLAGLIGFVGMENGWFGTWWPVKSEVFGILANTVFYIVVSLATPKPTYETVKRWFCKDYYTEISSGPDRSEE